MSGIPLHTCSAKCRRTGQPCKNRPMANGRCRMHGGGKSGRPPVHGRYTNAAIEQRKKWLVVERELRTMVDELE